MVYFSCGIVIVRYAVDDWKEDLQGKLYTIDYPLPILLLANKCDLLENGIEPCVSEEEIMEYIETNLKDHPVMIKTVSAKTGENIESSFEEFIDLVYEHMEKHNMNQKEKTVVNLKEESEDSGACCS